MSIGVSLGVLRGDQLSGGGLEAAVAAAPTVLQLLVRVMGKTAIKLLHSLH